MICNLMTTQSVRLSFLDIRLCRERLNGDHSKGDGILFFLSLYILYIIVGPQNGNQIAFLLITQPYDTGYLTLKHKCIGHDNLLSQTTYWVTFFQLTHDLYRP